MVGPAILTPTRFQHGGMLALVLATVLYQALTIGRSGGMDTAGPGIVDQSSLAGRSFLEEPSEATFLRVQALLATPDPSLIPTPETPAPEPLASEYEVVEGDSVYSIAGRFGISPETLVWANDLEDVDFLSIGQQLTIPRSSGVLHTVERGEDLGSIARAHGVSSEAILAYQPNGLVQPDLLPDRKQLLVPGGEDPRRPQPLLSSRGGLRLSDKTSHRLDWPTSGPITTYFGPYHAGIDLAPPYGTIVRAAADGQVVEAEKLEGGWGWYLVIDHGIGLATLYSHLSSFEVRQGEWVARGQAVGRVGTTGSVTGPNLHFEVWRNRTRVNPLEFLP